MKKNLSRLLIAGSILLTSAYAGEVRVQNNTPTAITVTVKGKENKSNSNPYTVTKIISPNADFAVTIDEKEYMGVTFSVQGITTPGVGILPLTSNECLLSGCNGRVEFALNSDGTILACGVTQLNK